MMKKLLAIGALAVAFPAQAAVTINYVGGASALPAGLTVIEDFDSLTSGSSIGSNAFVYDASLSGIAAMPAFNSSGNFGAVLGVPTSGSYSLSFAPTSIFSFVVGSLDTYNKLTLSFVGGAVEVLSGAGIIQGAVANGNQTLPNTNGRVTYTVVGTDPLITGATFESIRQNSFEFDNIAVAAVPEPSTWFLMLMGFAAVGFTMRRKQNVRVSFA